MKWAPERGPANPWLLALALFLLVALLQFLPFTSELQWRAQDGYFRLLPRTPASREIALILVDDQSLQQYGRWPWSRELLAQLLRNVSEGNARAVGLDVLLTEPQSPAADKALADALRASASTVVVDKIAGSAAPGGPHWIEPLPQFAEASSAVGHAQATLDGDGVCRRYPLRELGLDGVRWAFAIEVAQQFDAARTENFLRHYGVSEHSGDGALTVVKSQLVPIAYRRSEFLTLSAADVLQKRRLTELKGRAVLIGFGPTEISDRLSTPLTGSLPTPGVEIHAQILDSILSGRPLREAPAWLPLFLALLASPALVFCFRRWHGWVGFLVTALLVVAAWFAGYLLFRFASVLVPMMPLMLAAVLAPLLTHSVDFLAVERRLAAQLREMRRWLASRQVSDEAGAGLFWKLSTIEDLQSRLGSLYELHDRLVEATEDAVAVFDADGRPILKNRQFTALFSQGGTELTLPELRKRWFGTTDQGVNTERAEITLGAELFALRIAPLPGVNLAHEGGNIVTLSSLKTRQERDRARAEALGFVTHELRTPLVAIQGFAELMARHPSSPAFAEAPVTIYRESRRLVALINSYLDVLRMDSGGATIRREQVDLGDVIHQVLDLLQPLAADAKIQTKVIHGESLCIQGDTTLLTGAVLNLVSNAIKYGRAGSEVEVAYAREGAGVVISVYNPAQPLPEQELARLFEASYRASTTPADKPGWGLGLSFVKRIAEGHGGSVSAENVREGVRFEMRLPAAEVLAGVMGRSA